MSVESSVFGGLKRPKYTGENRCTPCTVVNLAIAIAASILVSIASTPLAIAAFAVSLLGIYFRGYLIPGTPELTKRYLPGSVLAYFEHGDGPTSTADPAADEEWETLEKLEYEREHAVDPEVYLRDAGIVREVTGETGETDDGAPNLTTTEAFETAVLDRTEHFASDGVSPSDLAAMFETDPESITFEDRDYPAALIDSRVRPWPSDAALYVDVAANEVLSDRANDWYNVPLEQRLDLLAALRSFYDRCPACDGAIEFDEAVVESCCRSYEVVTFACGDCGNRLVELPADAAEGDLLADARRD